MPEPYAKAARTLLHDTVMAAVDDLVRSRGWQATTMADVARAAGVSRQTVYNEFGSRQELVEAYVSREIEAMLTGVDGAVRAAAGDAHLALRTAFELFLKLASDEPLVQIIGSDADSGELIRLLTGVGQALAGDRVARLIPEVWPQVSEQDARLLGDSLVRLAISHALLPTQDPGVVAEQVGRMLTPFLNEILGVDRATG
jgi:AcrR family transcriptional regulator